MSLRHFRSFLVCFALCVVAFPLLAGEAVVLRGFGAVAVSAQYAGEGNARTSWITFTTEDAQHAAIIGSKYRADLLGFGDLKLLTNSSFPGTVIALDSTGLWLIGLDGEKCHVLFARSVKELTALAKRANAAAWKPTSERAYPRWLDCFDNAGPGIWYGGGGASIDNDTDFQWVKDRKFALCPQPPTESRYVAPGLVDTSITDWFATKAKEYDIPYRFLLWPRTPEWIWNRDPLPYLKQGPQYNIVHADLNYQSRASFSAFEPVRQTDRYTHDFRRRFAEGLNADPNFVGHHGLTEMPDAGVLELAVVAGLPEIKALWHSYLVHELGIDLERAGLLHKGRADAYRNWDEVGVPTQLDFIGWNDRCLDLRGTWEGLADIETAGTAAKWYAEGAPQEGWRPVFSNDPMLLIYADRNKKMDYWLRRVFTVTPEQAKDFKYLHIARAHWHGNVTPQANVCLNGQPLKAITKDERGEYTMCFELGAALRAGDNRIVLNTHGHPVSGYCFLGSVPFRAYPNMTEAENRLWFDTVNFSAWLRIRATEESLRAMRTADPNRPLKMMATINLLDMTQDLCERYGAYQHDTGGAGGYWAPMTGARLSRTHGLPWSCEQGGPPKDVAGMQAAMTFYLMYGNDAVDLVFGVTHYKDKPEIAAWVEQNLALMHCIGKMDLPLPPVGILRSTRATRLGFSDPWNWDEGRGGLQGVGRNFAYVEVPDITSGVIGKYPVVIDDGTVLLTEDEVAGLQNYVRQGGTFVAQFNTGRHSPSKANVWLLEQALGLKVTPKLMTDENYHRWPLGKIRFTEKQSLLPSLRGKLWEGSGVAIDYLGQEHTGALALTGEGSGITPVAFWEDGTMAVAEVKQGRGRFIILGTPFYLRMRDEKGMWVNSAQLNSLFDEFLTALGVPRDSWTGKPEVWAERWVSKNGIYDLYPVARMTRQGDERTDAIVKVRRQTAIREVVEMTANNHLRQPVAWKDGAFSLPAASYGQMQSRIYAAPRADVENAALQWFDVQRRHWRALPAIPQLGKPEVIPVPEDILPAGTGWRMTTGQAGTEWIQPVFDDAAWKTVKLGSYAAMGIPEDSVAQFRKSLVIPEGWKGQSVRLVFDAEGWFWGLTQKGLLWVDGQPAPLKQPITPSSSSGFSFDVTEQAKDGKLTLALEIDGRLTDPKKKRNRPSGALGLFYLQAEKLPVATQPLAGPWFAAKDVNVLTPAEIGKQASYVYLETKFILPAQWPGKRLMLESPGHLGWVVLNGTVVGTPGWMRSLDISGLVNRQGENVLRWTPATYHTPSVGRVYNKAIVPPVQLTWLP
ncbi:MAG: hypothetical protein ACYC7E_10895 [Armatimonadota bacterium]